MLTNPEGPQQPDIIQSFNRLYEAQLIIERRKDPRETESYPRYRAMKETLRSKGFAELPIEANEINTLAGYLLNNNVYSQPFREWLRTRKFEKIHNTLPPQTALLYVTAELLTMPQHTP